MKKIFLLTIVSILLVLGGWYFFAHEEIPEIVTSDPLNTTYLIEEEEFALVDGFAEKDGAPDSATKNKVSIFGEPVFGDVDKDGDDDAVVILVNNPGGSGTFYYAAIAANIDGVYKGTDAIFLGDRIAPQTHYIEDNRAKVNYAVRALEDDFSVQPSIGKSLHLQFNPKTLRLIQVEVNFEGEADPNVMTLNMHTWNWIRTIYNNDTEITPNESGAFTLSFTDNGMFSATTDCNAMSGVYEAKESKIAFKDIVATVMFCEDSQEQEFSSMITEVVSFLFTTRGELILELPFDSGSMVFR